MEMRQENSLLTLVLQPIDAWSTNNNVQKLIRQLLNVTLVDDNTISINSVEISIWHNDSNVYVTICSTKRIVSMWILSVLYMQKWWNKNIN